MKQKIIDNIIMKEGNTFEEVVDNYEQENKLELPIQEYNNNLTDNSPIENISESNTNIQSNTFNVNKS